MSDGLLCPQCGHRNPPKAQWCAECRRALPERSPRAIELRAGLDELDERGLLARLVESQAVLIEELEQQSVWLRTVGWAAGVWLLLVVIGLVVGLVIWLV